MSKVFQKDYIRPDWMPHSDFVAWIEKFLENNDYDPKKAEYDIEETVPNIGTRIVVTVVEKL